MLHCMVPMLTLSETALYLNKFKRHTFLDEYVYKSNKSNIVLKIIKLISQIVLVNKKHFYILFLTEMLLKCSNKIKFLRFIQNTPYVMPYKILLLKTWASYSSVLQGLVYNTTVLFFGRVSKNDIFY